MLRTLKLFALACTLASPSIAAVDRSNDSLPPMSPETLPADIPSLWATFDASKHPINMEVLHTYEDQGVTIQMISYAVGIFKGKEVRMGGYLAYPSDMDEKLPGIVQIHGGGQRATHQYSSAIAQNGYVVLATNWGGRLMHHQEPDQPAEGTIATDWSPLDATQQHNGWFANTAPDELTYDDFDSPRNNNWFLINLANKRAITALQQLDFVDAEKIGVHGHSMGGKLSVMLAGTDNRVKVAVPSCGGTGNAPAELKARPGNCAHPQQIKPLYAKYIDDAKMLPYITCPILYKGPQNDFNGMLSQLAFNWAAIPAETSVRYSITPHMNHRHSLESEFVDLLMFEEYLKGTYKLPETPQIHVDLKGNAIGPVITVKPDPSQEIERVEIFYSQDPNGQFRFNRSVEVTQHGDLYIASAPITSTDLGFFAMANVYYKHPKSLQLKGAFWKPTPGESYILSTNVQKFEIHEVQAAQPVVTDTTTRMIQASFDNDGLPDWYRYSQNRLNTRKIRDPKWRGPIGATLVIDVLDLIGENLIMEFSFNSYSKYGREFPQGEFYCVMPIEASPDWQTVEINIDDLKAVRADQRGMPADWQTLDHLIITHSLDVRVEGSHRTFTSNAKHGQGRQLRNMQWVGGDYPQTILMNGGGLELSAEQYEQQFNSQIAVSIDLEEKIDGLQKAKD
jgi:dienelactone hydrolase